MTNDLPTYAGFWSRTLASLIDTLWMSAILVPVLVSIYGWAYFDGTKTSVFAGPADILLTYVAPAVAVVAFWIYRQATPGKSALGLKVVDATTGGPLSPKQAILRYIGYYVSTIPLFIGILWVAFDERKQGWHDKIAGTVVIKVPKA
ncbi:MAG: hypothetical protein RLZZ618_176 [Pseudomonadota bacterium]|jgi:uncharacterized RDD family membrane protein YckC